MDLIYLFKVLLRKLWILIVVPGVAALIGFFFAFTSEEQFRSTAQIATGLTTRNDQPLGDDSFNFRESEIRFSNLMETMNSDLVTNLVSFKLMLHDLQGNQSFRKETLPDKSPITSDPHERARAIKYLKSRLDSMKILSNFNSYDRQIAKLMRAYKYDHLSLKNTLNISRIKYTDYILVSAETESPQLSAFMVNSLCEEFIRYNNNNKLEKSDESVRFFASLVTQKKRELDEKSEALKVFKYSNKVSDYRIETQLQEEQIAQNELLKQQEERRLKELTISLNDVQKRLEQFRSGSSGSQDVRENIMRLKNKIQTLNARFIETGSSDPILMDSLVALRKEYKNETNKLDIIIHSGTTSQQSIADLETQFNTLNLNLQITESALSSVNFKLRTMRAGKSDFAGKEIAIADLQREVDVASKEYLDAQARYSTARNTAMANGSTMKQVMIGQPALSPESRHTVIITAFSWFSSLALCIFVVLVIEFFDFSIKTPVRFKRITGLNLAGTLNFVRSVKGGPLTLRDIFLRKDPDAEKFKHFIRNFRYEIQSSKQKVFLFTSTKAGEGKTFSIVAVAYSLSLIKKRVLIVDTNFKNNQLSKILGEPAVERKKLQEGHKAAMSFAKETEWDEDTKHPLVTSTIYKNVDKVESKTSHKSASEILIQKDFSGLLQEFAPSYDYIFLEGASLNNYSDTKELSEFADRIIPVFSSESDIKQIDEESIAYLKSLKDKLFGAILNKINVRDLKV